MSISHCGLSPSTDTPPLSSLMTTRQVMSLVGIHQNSLYNYVRRDLLHPYRVGDNGNLRWSEDQIRDLFSIPRPKERPEGKKIAILARVSTPSQKSMLATQVENLRQYVLENYGDNDPLVYSNICSSFGDRGKDLHAILFRIMDKGDISHIVYSWRDRLSRVKCLTNLIHAITKKYGVTLVQAFDNEDFGLEDESYSELVEFI